MKPNRLQLPIVCSLSVIIWGVTLKEWSSEVVSFQSFEQLLSLYFFHYWDFWIILSFFFFFFFFATRFKRKVTILTVTAGQRWCKLDRPPHFNLSIKHFPLNVLPNFIIFSLWCLHFFLFQVFPGNSDRHSVVKHFLITDVMARYVRFYPVTYHNFPCFRVEIFVRKWWHLIMFFLLCTN